MRQVTLVTGPPCAGKTTWTRQQAAPGDAVLDWDDLARSHGSTVRWRHDEEHAEAAELEMRRRIAQVAAAESGTFWVIRCVPLPERRLALAEQLRADRVVVLLPSVATLRSRAARRGGARPATEAAIRSWLRRYAPTPGDDLNPAPPSPPSPRTTTMPTPQTRVP